MPFEYAATRIANATNRLSMAMSEFVLLRCPLRASTFPQSAPTQLGHHKADHDRGRQHPGEDHSGLAVGGKNLRINDDYVGHRKEGRGARDGFGFEVVFGREWTPSR